VSAEALKGWSQVHNDKISRNTIITILHAFALTGMRVQTQATATRKRFAILKHEYNFISTLTSLSTEYTVDAAPDVAVDELYIT